MCEARSSHQSSSTSLWLGDHATVARELVCVSSGDDVIDLCDSPSRPSSAGCSAPGSPCRPRVPTAAVHTPCTIDITAPLASTVSIRKKNRKHQREQVPSFPSPTVNACVRSPQSPQKEHVRVLSPTTQRLADSLVSSFKTLKIRSTAPSFQRCMQDALHHALWEDSSSCNSPIRIAEGLL
jgi:hypothetical protein